jgi:hypothetical protein
VLRTIVVAALTPLLEKNVLKTMALDVPVMFSMSRLIVLTFAVAILRQIWRAGIAGWPEASLAIAIVLALPILGALERVEPRDVLEVGKAFIGRLGEGGVRSVGALHAQPSSEPSKYDDHRADHR